MRKLQSAQAALEPVAAEKEKKDAALENAKANQQAAQRALTNAQNAKAEQEKKIAQAKADAEAASDVYWDAIAKQKEAESEQAKAEDDLATAQIELKAAQDKVDAAQKDYEEALEFQKDAEKLIEAGSYGFFAYKENENAMKILTDDSKTVKGDTAPIISYTNIGDEKDATSLENMKMALAFIKECNDLRVGNGLEPLKVSNELMAISQVQANWSAYNTKHSKLYPVSENLAWGYIDPFSGWYTREKEIYENGGGSIQTGHYRNIVNEKFGLTGFAVNQYYGVTHEQSFSCDKDYYPYKGTGVDFDTYYNDFMEYYDAITNADEYVNEVKSNLDAAKAELEAAKKKVEAAEKVVAAAKDKKDAVDKTVEEAFQDTQAKDKAWLEESDKLVEFGKNVSTCQDNFNLANSALSVAQEAADQTNADWEAKKAVAEKAQQELDALQASQEEKQKNYEEALKAVKACGGNESATAESAQAHKKSAEKALEDAKKVKTEAESAVTQKELELESAKSALKTAESDVNEKKTRLAETESARDKIEAEISQNLEEKREDVEAKQAVLTQTDEELTAKTAIEMKAAEAKQTAEAAQTAKQAALMGANVELQTKEQEVAEAVAKVEKAQSDYDTAVEGIQVFRKAKAIYDAAVAEEETAKNAYDEALKTAEEYAKELAVAEEEQKKAESQKEAAKNLSYEKALTEEVTEEGFTYLNTYIAKEKEAEQNANDMQMKYDTAVLVAQSAKAAYDEAKLESAKSAAEVAIAQATYDKFVAEKKAQDAIEQAKADAESKAEAEKIRQVLKQKASVDNYNDIINTSNKTQKVSSKNNSVKTGDVANVVGLAGAMGLAGLAAADAMSRRKKEY